MVAAVLAAAVAMLPEEEEDEEEEEEEEEEETLSCCKGRRWALFCVCDCVLLEGVRACVSEGGGGSWARTTGKKNKSIAQLVNLFTYRHAHTCILTHRSSSSSSCPHAGRGLSPPAPASLSATEFCV